MGGTMSYSEWIKWRSVSNIDTQILDRVQNELLPTIATGLNPLGTWNAATNTPSLASGVGGNSGDYYVVSVSGSTNIDGESDWVSGDWIIFNGTTWGKIDNSDKVSSVFSRTGTVVASNGDYNASQITNTPAGGIQASTVQGAINELDTEKIDATGIRSAGVVVTPTFTDNGDGSVTVGTGQYSLYDNANFIGAPKTYTIAGGTFTLTDNSPNYIVATYNAGTPIVSVITAVPPANSTDSDLTPIFSCYRAGNDIHKFNWDNLALGLAEKINQRLRRTDRFHIDNGLSLSETGSRYVDITSGQVWAGANLISMNSINSNGSPNSHIYYHIGGIWTRGSATQYNNTQYDNGTGLVTLSNNKYAVNWIYRSVEETGALYMLLGNGDYSLIEAQASAEPPKPAEIATQGILVGRIIVQKNAATATEIDRVSSATFGTASVINHNDLSQIQGGTTDEHYHLTQAQHTSLTSLDHGTIGGLADDDHPQYSTTTGTISAVTYNAGGTSTITLNGRTDIFTATAATGGTTWAISGNEAGKTTGFVLKLTNGGSQTQTWPAGTKYEGGVAPTLTAAGIDWLTFLWDGSNWAISIWKDVK